MDLVFTKSQTRETFTNSSTSQFNDKNEHALLRELIQNSLDAARPDTPALINISHLTVTRNEVPGLDSLGSALKKAEEFNRDFSNTKQIVTGIDKALNSDEIDLLIIRDNGVGLNIDRMNDILHDGASRKDPGSVGSYGNGHFTTFKFSDLLYVLYLGVSNNDGVLVSGHTILASHESEDGLRGKDGFLTRQILDDRENGFEFFDEADFNSEFISNLIAEIKGGSGSGSCVVITAFSHTSSNMDLELKERIERISGIHFFPSILDGKLSITYKDLDDDETRIDQASIPLILNSFSQEAQSRGLRGGPRGDKTYEAFLTYTSENRIAVPTSLGEVECYLRTNKISRHNINLFRKGMWISQKIKGLEERYFDGFEAFDLVINIEYENNPELHDLIQASEGSLHMHLESRNGHEDKWRELCSFWKEFREALKHFLTEQSYKDFSPPDFALVDISDNEHADNQGNVPVEKWRRKPKRENGDEPTPPPTPEDNCFFKIPGIVADINGNARRTSSNTLIAMVRAETTINFPELRVAEMLGADATCELRGDARLTDLNFCEIEELFINDEKISFKNNSQGIRKRPRRDGEPTGVFAIRLSEFDEDELIKIKVKFLPILGDSNSTIRLDFVDRTKEMEAENA